MRQEYVWIAATALCWGSYPLVARAAGYQGPRAAFILMLAAFVPIAWLALLDARAGWPVGNAWLKLSIAGVLMGFGLIAFMRVAGGALDASIALPIVDVAMLLVSALGAVWFFAEPLTLQKGLGIALLLGGIALLRPA